MNYRPHLIKFGFTALLVALLLWAVDFRQLQEKILSVSLPALLTAAVGYALTQIITAVRWHVLLQAAGIQCRLARAVRAVFIGMYVNAFCFGTVGGDLARAMLVAGGKLDKGVSLATVIADRALGLGVLAAIGIVSGLAFGSLSQQPQIAFTAVGVIVLAVVGWRFAPSLTAIASRTAPRFAETLTALGRAFPRDGRVLSRAIALAIAYHLSQIAVIGVIIGEIGGAVPWSYLLFAVPFINIISTLPLSWMGVGVRETGYVLFFSPLYLSRESALLAGMVWLLGMTVAGAVGGIVAALSGDYGRLTEKGRERG